VAFEGPAHPWWARGTCSEGENSTGVQVLGMGWTGWGWYTAALYFILALVADVVHACVAWGKGGKGGKGGRVAAAVNQHIHPHLARLFQEKALNPCLQQVQE
jgi:hypothetical protein